MTEIVAPKRELKKRLKIAKIVNAISKVLKELPQTDLNEMKTNPELIKYVCNLVENTIKKKYTTDKKSIVLQILTSVISITEPDKKIVSDTIEFLHKNGDIRKINTIKLITKYTIGFVKKTIF
jgi:hypothetical protein